MQGIGIVKMDNGNSCHEPESRAARFVAHKLYMHDRCSRYFLKSKTQPSCWHVWGMMVTKNRIGKCDGGRMLDIFDENFYLPRDEHVWHNVRTDKYRASAVDPWNSRAGIRSEIVNRTARYKSIYALWVANAAIIRKFIFSTKIYRLDAT